MGRKRKNKQKLPRKLEVMTPVLLKKMKVLESKNKVRLLFDFNNSQMFIAFNGATNQSYYSANLNIAELFYKKLVTRN
ncbi:hypothetical protein [Kordia jejudonensis]|uniref:hypothetical protein n=1 Tax=Kordia jejudonensis TaxID=1348245 RepID=UPI0006299FFF|nr:hypothetical protein [Kordia jejudonensis]